MIEIKLHTAIQAGIIEGLLEGMNERKEELISVIQEQIRLFMREIRNGN